MPSTVLGVLAIAAAVLTSPLALAPLLADDGKIDEPLVRLGLTALEICLFFLGTGFFLHGRPRRWGPFGAPLAVVFGALCVLGLAGLARHFAVDPWEAPGLAMQERLALLAERDAEVYFYGRDPAEIEAEIERLAKKPSGALRTLELERQLADTYLRRGEFTASIRLLEGILERMEGSEAPRRDEFVDDVENLLISAYLRWGEIENCSGNHNEDSCLLPLAGGGVHVDPRGMRGAVGVLEGKLARDPDDLLSRWLLNIAHMAIGDYPDGVPERFRLDPMLFESDEDFPRFRDVAPALGLAANELAGGCALEDFDGDGDLDLFASGMGRDDPLRYFENEGDAGFVERTSEAGLEGLRGGLNMCHADYDNDGRPDLLVLRGAWKGPTGGLPNSLLRNVDGRRFEDVTEQAGLLAVHATSSAAWGDLDNDGFLDLFVGNESRDWHPHASAIYRNRGDGTFEDVTAGSGIGEHAFVKGCALGDVDGDGLLDLFVSRRYRPSSLYRNEGDFKFVDVTRDAGLGETAQTFATWFFDMDNDGDLDLFVAGFAGSFLDDEEGGLPDIPAVRMGLETARDGFPRLYRNRGDGTFDEVADAYGLQRVILVMGANFGDIDNDGWLDMYLGTGKPDFRGLMANRMFRNDRGERFLDVTTAGGFGHLQKGHAVAFGDVDNDGDQDVYAVLGGAYPADAFPNALFRNPGNANRWLTLRLEGTESNRSAIGARVTVRVRTAEGERSFHRAVGTGGSFGSSSLQQEIGLGDAVELLGVDVRWPKTGTTQTFTDLSLDRVYRIVEGADLVEAVPTRAFHPSATRSHHGHSH